MNRFIICFHEVSDIFIRMVIFRCPAFFFVPFEFSGFFGCLESRNDNGCIGENGGQWYQGINEELRIDCGDSCQVDQGTNKIPSLEKWKNDGFFHL